METVVGRGCDLVGSIRAASERVTGTNLRKVKGSDRKGIRPQIALELQQTLSANQEANSTIPHRE